MAPWMTEGKKLTCYFCHFLHVISPADICEWPQNPRPDVHHAQALWCYSLWLWYPLSYFTCLLGHSCNTDLLFLLMLLFAFFCYFNFHLITFLLWYVNPSFLLSGVWDYGLAVARKISCTLWPLERKTLEWWNLFKITTWVVSTFQNVCLQYVSCDFCMFQAVCCWLYWFIYNVPVAWWSAIY